jgi:hypothetical protein
MSGTSIPDIYCALHVKKQGLGLKYGVLTVSNTDIVKNEITMESL